MKKLPVLSRWAQNSNQCVMFNRLLICRARDFIEVLLMRVRIGASTALYFTGPTSHLRCVSAKASDKVIFVPSWPSTVGTIVTNLRTNIRIQNHSGDAKLWFPQCCAALQGPDSWTKYDNSRRGYETARDSLQGVMAHDLRYGIFERASKRMCIPCGYCTRGRQRDF